MASNATVDRILQSVAPSSSVDRTVLARLLRERPRPPDILPLFSAAEAETVRAAVVYLGLYGTMTECSVLALCLQHADDEVAHLAERCLWSLWMQAGTETGNRHLAKAIRHIERAEYAAAIRILSDLLAHEPSFAEAHFQRGVALSLDDRIDEAAQAYREALRLNPHHFGATAALGHTCVDQANLSGALYYYRRALQIHPRMEDVPDALREVETIFRARHGK